MPSPRPPKKELIEVRNSAHANEKQAAPAKRVYVTVNAAAFIINQVERRFSALCNLLIEIDRELLEIVGPEPTSSCQKVCSWRQAARSVRVGGMTRMPSQ